jgi:hypothetical protein
MDALIAQLLRLAVAWTGYPEPDVTPVVQIVSAQQMPCPCMGFFRYSTQIQGYGATIEAAGYLLLREDVDLSTPHGSSILLHELVHALQGQHGPAQYGSPIWHRREREAYQVQFRYLRASGVALTGGIARRHSE